MTKIIQSILFSLLVFLSVNAFAGSVNINTADAETLTSSLSGIGEKKAVAIVDYRNQNGPFQSIDELTMVKGIGESILEKNRENLTVD